jgi:hypothetical protein
MPTFIPKILLHMAEVVGIIIMRFLYFQSI